MKKPQFVIAAPTSNSGKTTLTLGLLRALEQQKINTQAFKVGPDYIDPKFHEVANGKQSVNLDLYMMTEAQVKTQYAQYSEHKEVVCVEGVMGLFDGAKKAVGSTAAVAKVLDLPVVLVVNAKATAYSVAPLLYGFKNFDKNVKIAGVIFNNVNTASHYQFLKEACEDVGIPSFGYVPFVADCEIPSRHLGLSINNMQSYTAMIDKMADAMTQTVALDALLEATQTTVKETPKVDAIQKRDLKIAIAKDESFNFSYVQNIHNFSQLGKITFFSPLQDKMLPETDLLYLPGGYPELYTQKLSENKDMLLSIKRYADCGGKILAECGGMMYLGKSIITKDGKEFEMANVFDFKTSLTQMKLHLGYRDFLGDGLELKGHEFHYSELIEDDTTKFIGNFKNARGKEVATKLYCYKNVKASYMHYYLGTVDEIVALMDL